MKRLSTLLTIVVFILMVKGLLAQCTPDPYITNPGIYPDSASGFPPAVATYPYNLTITVVVPADTLIPPLPLLPIDSIGVTGVEGLPEGFQFLPSRPSGFWPGGTKGCALITGTPTKAQVGEYPLVFHVVGYISNLPFPYDVTFYSIKVLDSTHYGIDDSGDKFSLEVSQLSPNDQIQLFISSPTSGNFLFQLYNINGLIVYSETLNISAGESHFSIKPGKLPKGIYFISLSRAKSSQKIVRRILL
jgi:hypothetical protein